MARETYIVESREYTGPSVWRFIRTYKLLHAARKYAASQVKAHRVVLVTKSPLSEAEDRTVVFKNITAKEIEP